MVFSKCTAGGVTNSAVNQQDKLYQTFVGLHPFYLVLFLTDFFDAFRVHSCMHMTSSFLDRRTSLLLCSIFFEIVFNVLF